MASGKANSAEAEIVSGDYAENDYEYSLQDASFFDATGSIPSSHIDKEAVMTEKKKVEPLMPIDHSKIDFSPFKKCIIGKLC